MSGRQGGTSQATHATGQLQHAAVEAEAARPGLQATKAQTDQIAQIAHAVAAAMDKIAATSQEMAEHAAQLWSLSTAPSGAAVLPLARPREPTQALADRVVPAEASSEITAATQTAAVIPLQPGRALPADRQDLAEVTPAATYTHRKQELDLLDWTISNLFHIGLILLPAARQRGEAEQGTAEALQCLDDTICRIRDHVRDAHANGC
jgi:hypothetical protein